MRFNLLAITLLMFCSHALHAQQETVREHVLPVKGRTMSGDKKLEACNVLVFQGNEPLTEQMTGRDGKFATGLPIGGEYAIEFRREGYMPKRVLVDTRMDKLPEGTLIFEPLDLTVSLLEMERYAGADADVLDFPCAIVRWDRKAGQFAADEEYANGMMRANGAVLLMAARATKR